MSFGGESFLGTNEGVWVSYPTDIFYDPSKPDESAVFPVEVEVESRSCVAIWPLYWIPSQFLIDIYIRDWDSNAPESVFDLGDCHALAVLLGTNISWNFTIEANAGDTGIVTSHSDTLTYSVSRGHWKTVSDYYHLGQVQVDVNENSATTQAGLIIVLDVLVSNHNAPSYENNRYTLFVRVTVPHALWWWISRYGEGNNFVNEFPYLGDGLPSTTDAILYLLRQP